MAMTARVAWLRERRAICYYPARRRIDGVLRQPSGQPRRPLSAAKRREPLRSARWLSGAALVRPGHGFYPGSVEHGRTRAYRGPCRSARRSTKAGGAAAAGATIDPRRGAAAARAAGPAPATTEEETQRKRRRSTTRNTRYRQSVPPFRTTVDTTRPRSCSTPPSVSYTKHKYQ